MYANASCNKHKSKSMSGNRPTKPTPNFWARLWKKVVAVSHKTTNGRGSGRGHRSSNAKRTRRERLPGTWNRCQVRNACLMFRYPAEAQGAIGERSSNAVCPPVAANMKVLSAPLGKVQPYLVRVHLTTTHMSSNGRGRTKKHPDRRLQTKGKASGSLLLWKKRNENVYMCHYMLHAFYCSFE